MFFKQRLSSTDVLRGVFNVIPSAVVTQAIATAGADLVVIDREHGPIGRETMQAMIAATAGTDCATFVRVPAIDESEVKAALDAGAEGIVYPLVRSAPDAERCVSYMTYPPEGVRGWGPFVAHSRFRTSIEEHAPNVGPQVTCCLLIETVDALENIEEILRVPGVDLVVVAPFDLSTALGVPGRFESPVFVEAVAVIERAVRAQGMPVGGVALDPELSASLVNRGYRVLLNGVDVLMLKDQIGTFQGWG